ncbi:MULTISPECIES: Sec-independent protein translocase protein TatB [Corynebacterium]|uniref:Sec-independent protein translocase protein TatB n=1 Tax=Corynebacterium hadale TaxID=2026255 RepID=A0A269PGF9_9CORY|nr:MULTISPECIES: Sec-independent protein translocase protein TatB [Corynebacterium]PAJ70440.1 twin-arginine translocase subunit TatB [Corynebacterium hadale]PAT08969.1 twin-arginine translocase subunit TatB [Corynebacterium hadale]PAT11959.1 twin-arginine translocase subunit TatB [Corynebacterium hadale]PAT15734.1 twin-arginine translocase subunit TatB [Corynebacterium sp. NML 120412]TVX81622.1 twin-arginine translocase subunit TatB [Corynebacterium sp. NML180780]
MFSNIGWGEIFFILIIGLIVIGPERLPGVIQDVRAAIYAARKAINNAKAELNGEFEEFEEFRAPMQKVSKYAAMGPKRAMAQMLFDDDVKDANAPGHTDPRAALRDDPQARTPKPPVNPGEPGGGSTRQVARRDAQGKRKPDTSGGGFSWADIT